MCGRFTQTFSWQTLHDLLSMTDRPVEFAPRYNVAPGQKIAAVRMEGNQRRLAWLRWGLIPGWVEDPAVRHRLINARSETASTRPSFRSAFRSRRCLIPASGFYEWRRNRAVRQPYLISRVDGQPMVFAGLWERWTVPRGKTLTGSLAAFAPGEDIETCTILTTAANALVAQVHNRMPVILPPEAFGVWLGGEQVLLVPCAPETLASRPVSTAVNDHRNDDPRCLDPA